MRLNEDDALAQVLDSINRFRDPTRSKARTHYKKRVVRVVEQRVCEVFASAWRHLNRQPQKIGDLILYSAVPDSPSNRAAYKWIVRTLCYECFYHDDVLGHKLRGYWVLHQDAWAHQLVEQG